MLFRKVIILVFRVVISTYIHLLKVDDYLHIKLTAHRSAHRGRNMKSTKSFYNSFVNLAADDVKYFKIVQGNPQFYLNFLQR